MDGLAWAAGLFEGEGSVTVSRGRRRLQLKMTEQESVRRFHGEIGAGRVYGPYANQTGVRDGYPRSPFWMWVAELDDADRAARLLYPLLSAWRQERLCELFPDVVADALPFR